MSVNPPRIERAKQYGFIDVDGKVRWFNFEWRYVGTSNCPDRDAAVEYIRDQLAAGKKRGVVSQEAGLTLVSRTYVRTQWERMLPRIHREEVVR